MTATTTSPMPAISAIRTPLFDGVDMAATIGETRKVRWRAAPGQQTTLTVTLIESEPSH